MLELLPTVASGALRYQPNQTPGKAYTEAEEYYCTHSSEISENIVLRSQFTKACSDNLIKGTPYKHTKGLMLDLFLRNMPNWVGSIVVVDDNSHVIESIENFTPVQNSTTVPPLTIIPVTKCTSGESGLTGGEFSETAVNPVEFKINLPDFSTKSHSDVPFSKISPEAHVTNNNLDEVYYNKKLEEHQRKALTTELNYLKTTCDNISDADTIKKINTLITKVELLIEKENTVDLVNAVVLTNRMLAILRAGII